MPCSLAKKLELERLLPENSAGVRGFPYFTVHDRQGFEWYIRTGDPRYRPPVDKVLERFPIRTRMIKGAELSPIFLGVFDGSSNFWTIHDFAPENPYVPDATVLWTTDGQRFVARHNREYQIIEYDLGFMRQG